MVLTWNITDVCLGDIRYIASASAELINSGAGGETLNDTSYMEQDVIYFGISREPGGISIQIRPRGNITCTFKLDVFNCYSPDAMHPVDGSYMSPLYSSENSTFVIQIRRQEA